MSGIFITIEGPDGAGKTTVLKELVEQLRHNMSTPIVATREPGGIDISEKIRSLILDPAHTEMDDRTEALLYAAARRQHLIQKVFPALKNGDLVICDRFVDSSLAYQGAARGIGMTEVAKINDFAIEGRQPDLTLYLDVPSEVGLDRIAKGRKATELDRLDTETLAFHKKVRQAYLELVSSNPDRMVRIDTVDHIENVVKNCYDVIEKRYPELFDK